MKLYHRLAILVYCTVTTVYRDIYNNSDISVDDKYSIKFQYCPSLVMVTTVATFHSGPTLYSHHITSPPIASCSVVLVSTVYNLKM